MMSIKISYYSSESKKAMSEDDESLYSMSSNQTHDAHFPHNGKHVGNPPNSFIYDTYIMIDEESCAVLPDENLPLCITYGFTSKFKQLITFYR